MADGRVIIEIEAQDSGLVRTLEQVRQQTNQAAGAIARQSAAGEAAAGSSLRHASALRLQSAALELTGASARTAAGNLTAFGAQTDQLSMAGLAGQLTSTSALARRWGSALMSAFSQAAAGARSSASGLSGLQSAFYRTSGAASSMAAGIRAGSAAAQSAVSAMASGAVNAVSVVPQRFLEVGGKSGAAMASGLRQSQGPVIQSAHALTQGALSGVNSAQTAFRQSGFAAASGYAQGIGSGSGAAANAASSVANQAKAAMSIGGWYGLGYNISAGVASGVRGGSGLISAAARSAAQSALASAKRTLGVRSPSRVFRVEVGQQIPAGLAQGILDAAPQAERAVGRAVQVLSDTGKAALRPSGAFQTGVAAAAVSAGSHTLVGEAQKPMVIETPVYLDGREIARASARYQGRRMAYLEGL